MSKKLSAARQSVVLCMIVLLGMTIIGHFNVYTGIRSEPKAKDDELDIDLVRSTKSIDDLQEQTIRVADSDSLSDQQKMELLFDIVAKRFTHKNIRHTFFTNWPMWFFGIPHSEIRAMRDPDNMMKYGSHGFCSQVSYVLVTLAEQNGIPARHVDIKGTHVVMEAWFDGGWHMYDPDYEIIPQTNGMVLSLDQLGGDRELLEKMYKDTPSVIEGLQNKQLYSFARRGHWFIWSSQALMYIEMATDYLKFLIPIVVTFIAYRKTEHLMAKKSMNTD